MAVGIWLLLRVVVNTDPNINANRIFFLASLLLAAGALGSILSWFGLAQRWPAPKSYGIAVRQGVWIGLLVMLVALFKLANFLTFYAVGATLLVLGGLEAILLLQGEENAGSPPPVSEEG